MYFNNAVGYYILSGLTSPGYPLATCLMFKLQPKRGVSSHFIILLGQSVRWLVRTHQKCTEQTDN